MNERGVDQAGGRREWSLLSSHGQVLAYVCREADPTVRRLSDALNFSERRIMGVLRDLEGAGMIARKRRGRQNVYVINQDARLRAPMLRDMTVREFLAPILPKDPPAEQAARDGSNAARS